MRKDYRVVDEETGLTQVTTDDERWYFTEIEDKGTGKKKIVYMPSVTWIVGYYPKGIAYMKWLAQHGWDEAEAIKNERGRQGDRVHQAIELLTLGEVVKFDDPILDKTKNELEPLSPEEYGAVMSFKEWWESHEDIEIIESEHTVWNEKLGFAGTVDLIVRIGKEYWIIDVKTSQYVWPSHELQVSAYKHAYEGQHDVKLAILQVGYERNKTKKWKFTEVDDKFHLFEACKEIWKNECEGIEPKQRDYPNALQLEGVVPNRSK